MRFDISNYKALKTAVAMYDKEAPEGEPLVLIFYDTLRTPHRFIVGQHGVTKEDCNATGAPT